jgi:hypothetical protein
MNGFSLLFALASFGVTGQVVIGPDNQLTYNIGLEPLVVEQLRRGEDVTTDLSPNDRGVRRFRIFVIPDKGTSSRAGDVSQRPDDMVEWEAFATNKNEIEMWVRIMPERLLTLVAGRAIEGEIPAHVPAVHRFRVLVSVDKLRSSQPPAGTQLGTATPGVLGGNDHLGPIPAETSIQYQQPTPRVSAPALRTAQTPSGAAPTSGSRGTVANGVSSPRFNSGLRNTPDESTAPALSDRFSLPPGLAGAPPLASGYNDDRNYGPAAGQAYNPYLQQQLYNDRGQPVGNANSGMPPPQWGTQTTGGNNTAWSPSQQQTYVGRQETALLAAAQPSGAVPQGYSGSGVNTQPMMNNPAFGQAVPGGQMQAGGAQITMPAVAAPPTAAAPTAAPAVIVTKDADSEPAKSSTPLILTTLALFTSMGVNTYLGWLAYSFFWRYRDAVNDSVRARAYNVPGRQAA